jgi:hypothetical protein
VNNNTVTIIITCRNRSTVKHNFLVKILRLKSLILISIRDKMLLYTECSAVG